jgi:hypothetical protein
MNTSYDSALRSLDAAAGTLDDGHRQRAEALLERILATPADAAPDRARGRMRGGLVVWISAVAAAIAIGFVALQGTGESGAAYASWTATPSAVAAHDLDAVVRACRDQLHPYADTGVNPDAIPVALAERRGDFVAVLFHQDNPDLSASCVARNPAGSTQVDDIKTGIGGSSGPAWTPPAGRITQGAISEYGGKQPASFTDGAVGTGVVGVTIHAGSQTVTASVKDGRYAAWWPGKVLSDGPLQPDEAEPQPFITYDVHLADGRVKANVAVALPR